MASYNDMDGTPTQGAGYSEEDIDNGTGLAPTSTAVVGYNPLDGTYTSKSQKYRQTRLQMLPTDTDRPRINRANAAVNEANKALYTNPKVSGLLSLYDEQSGGHGFEPYRDTLDDYMAHEYGRSKYDKESGDLNVLTSDRAKANRAEEQTSLAVLANGLPRLAVRAATTVGSAVGGVVKGIADALGGNSGVDEYFSPEAMAGYADSFGDWMNKAVPVYQTREQEEAMENDPLSLTSLTSGQNVANFVDNVGFTLGAVIAARTFGKAGQSVMTGAAAMQLGSAAGKWLTDDDYKASNLIPLIMGVGMGGMSKALPKHLREKLAFVAANIMSAAGEAEVEAVHAKEDFIKEKGSVIDQEVARRKGLVAEEYRKMAGQAWAKAYNDAKAAGMDEASALEAADNAGEEAMATLADQMAILDWEGTRVKNRSISEADKAANVTRMLNLGVLTASNWIQFGRLFSGGYKTYRTMRGMAAAKGARDAADAAFDAALRGARTTAEKTAVRESRDAIRAEAMRRWAAETGQDVWQQTGKLTKRNLFDIIVKNPLTEGAEEMEQAMASNAAKAASEWRTDDYYSQISGTEAYREAESAVGAAWQSAFGALGDAQAWSEFLSGALMGAIGVPWLRSPFKKIDAPVSEADPTGAKADDKGIGGKLRAFRKLRSPLFFQGGIYGEWKAASEKREKMAAMATRLNEAMSDKGVERLRKLMGHIAHHMQYEKDKAMYADKAGSKYLFQNADDADLLNTLEMYQDSGNMDVFRGLVASMRGIKTAEELAQFRDMTSEDDGKGGKSGPYSEFNVMKLGPEATEEQRAANEEQAEAMRKKIAEDADHLRKTIDTYEKARRNLDLETGQSLGEKELNCLTWYKTRLSMFDERAKDMYSGVSGLIDGLSSNLDDFEKAVLGEVEAAIEAIRSAGEAGAKLGALESMYAANAPLLRDVAFPELKRRLSEAAKAGDDLAKARILFEGERKARPVIDTLTGRVGYATAWRGGKAEEERRRRQTAVSGLFEAIGAALRDDSTEAGKLMARLEPDADKRAEMADKMRDIKACQDAVVRYRDLYNLYRENPTVLTAAAKAQEEAVKEKTKEKEKEEVKKAVDDATSDKKGSKAKSETAGGANETTSETRQEQTVSNKPESAVARIYDAVLKMILEGKDIDTINEYLKEKYEQGDEDVAQFLRNQEYVRYYASALNQIILPGGTFQGRSVVKNVILQAMIDASRTSLSFQQMHDDGRKTVDEILSSKEAFLSYIEDNKLASDLRPDDLPDDVDFYVFGDDGDFIRDGKFLKTKSSGKSAIAVLRDSVKVLMDIADKIVKDKDAPQPNDKYMSPKEIAEYNMRIRNSTANYDIEKKLPASKALNALESVGEGINVDEKEATDEQITDNDSETVEEQQNADESAQDSAGSSEESQAQTVDNGNDAQTSEAELDALGTEDLSENVEVVRETAAVDSQREESKTSTWRPIMSYFNLAFKNTRDENGVPTPILVRNDRTKFVPGSKEMAVCEPGEAGWCQKFFATCEKLGMWRAIDEVSKDDPDYIKEGDEIYFVIDRMGENGKSQILGLDEDELSFGGKPIIWMCARRPDGTYQAVGSLATNKNKLLEYGQTQLDTDIRRFATINPNEAYVHSKTAKVESVQGGYVEIQGEENNLVRVFGSVENVNLMIGAHDGHQPITSLHESDNGHIVADGDMTDDSHVEDKKKEKKRKIRPGYLYALIKDNRSGGYRPMACRVAHYTDEYAARFRDTESWKTVEARIDDIINKAYDKEANNDIREKYSRLDEVLAVKAYGLHIDVKETKNGRSIVFPVRQMKDGKFVPMEGSKGDNRVKRTFYRMMLSGDIEQDKAKLKKRIKEFDIPFRVQAHDIKKKSTDNEYPQNLAQLLKDGIITTNIVDGRGTTHGGYVNLDAKSLNRVDEYEARRIENSKVSPVTREGRSWSVQNIYGHRVEYNSNERVGKDFFLDGKEPEGKLSVILREVLIEGTEKPVVYIDELREMAVYDESEHRATFIKFPEEGGEVHLSSRNVRPDNEVRFNLTCDLLRVASRITELTIPTSVYEKLDSKDLNGDNVNVSESASQIVRELVANADARSEFKALNPEIFDYDGEDAKQNRLRLIDDVYEICVRDKLELTRKDVKDMFQPTLNTQGEAAVDGEKIRYDSDTNEPVSENIEQEDGGNGEDGSNLEIPQNGEAGDGREKQGPEEEAKGEWLETGKGPSFRMRSKGNDAFSIVKPEDYAGPRVDVAKETEALRQMLPSMTRADAVRFVDGLIETGRKGEWAQGVFRDGLFIISKQAVRGTVFHEGFHCIFRTMLSDKQRKELLIDAKRVAGDDAMTDSEAEERLCDWYRDYAVDQVYGKSWTRRIKDFFRMLFHLANVSYERLRPVTFEIFCAAKRGEFGSRKDFYYQSVKEDRQWEWRRMGYTWDQIDVLEDRRNAWAARTAEERSMLADAGINEFSFNLLTPQEREEIIDCL